MVEMFLAHGVTPHGGNLQTAVFRGRPMRTVQALLEAGAPVDEVDEDGMTALRMAVQWGRSDVADLLVARGGDPSRVTDADRSIGAVVAGRPAQRGDAAPVSAPGLLDWACTAGDVVVVRRLLAAGTPVDGPPGADFVPLGQAAWRGTPTWCANWWPAARSSAGRKAVAPSARRCTGGALPSRRGRPDDAHRR